MRSTVIGKPVSNIKASLKLTFNDEKNYSHKYASPKNKGTSNRHFSYERFEGGRVIPLSGDTLNKIKYTLLKHFDHNSSNLRENGTNITY